MNTKFDYQLNKMTKFVLIALLAFIGLYLFTTISSIIDGSFELVSVIVSFLLSAFLIYAIVAYFKSQYIVDSKYLTAKISLLKSTIDIAEITTIRFSKVSNLLSICFFVNGSPRLVVMQLKESDNDDFVKALRAVNPAIVYQVVTDDK